MKKRFFLALFLVNLSPLFAQYTEQGYAAFFPSEKEGTVLKNGEVYVGTMAVVAHKKFEANTLLRIRNLDNDKVTTARVVENQHANADAFLMVSTQVGNLLGMNRYCMAQVSIEPYEDEDASTYGVDVYEHPAGPPTGGVAVSETITLPNIRRMRSFDDLDQNATAPVPIKPTNANMRIVENNVYNKISENTTPTTTVSVATPTVSRFGQTVQQAQTVINTVQQAQTVANTVGQVAGQLQNRVNSLRPQTPVVTTPTPTATPATTPAVTPVAVTPVNQPGYAPAYTPTPVYTSSPVTASVTAAPQMNLSFKWTVQVGVFSTPEAANNQMAILGSGAWYLPVAVNGRQMYKVNFNRYVDKAAADAAKVQLQQRTGLVGFSKEIQ